MDVLGDFIKFMVWALIIICDIALIVMIISGAMIDEQVVIINNLEDQGNQNVKILEKNIIITRSECGILYSAKYNISVKNNDGKKEYLWGCSSPFLGTYFKVQ